ncbi:MAG: glycoside hydrolase family 15 protein [Candidatus Omnitrophota bacterium]
MTTYNYGIIGNCTSAALVSEDASIDWLCIPFFDSPSLFAKLLDEKKGGFLKIEGVNTEKIQQNYIQHTGILKTIVFTQDGIFEINDYMPRFLTGRRDYYCPSEIHRNIRLISGRPRIRVRLDARPNYALEKANYEIRKNYIKITSQQGHYNSSYLYSDLSHADILDQKEIELPRHAFILLSYHEKLEPIDNDKIYIEYEKTKSYWLEWYQKLRYPKDKRYREDVVRSAITLKMLMYQRTGAVVAAATTSLPEIIGEGRNWDYRYCWTRDASMIIDLYIRIGDMASANRFISFILQRMLLKHEDIGVMYGINGEERLEEIELDHLAGYENSRPVRIGNDAYRQKQNDLYGELIETIYTYFVINRRSPDQIDEEIWTVARSLVNRVIEIWREPDSGIWERREHLGHYVHSKFMNWVAMDRAVKIAKYVNKPEYIAKWAGIAEDIRNDILQHGWNEGLQSFTMCYDSDTLDAANLLMLHYGFLPNDDPRMISMVRQSYKYLVRDGLTYRYTETDEFGEPKNAFVVCTFWMINALYLIGEEKRARQMFENLLQYSNHLKLFSEDVEIATKRLIGNFPQGYSHLALIQTAFLLETEYNWSDVYSEVNGGTNGNKNRTK